MATHVTVGLPPPAAATKYLEVLAEHLEQSAAVVQTSQPDRQGYVQSGVCRPGMHSVHVSPLHLVHGLEATPLLQGARIKVGASSRNAITIAFILITIAWIACLSTVSPSKS